MKYFVGLVVFLFFYQCLYASVDVGIKTGVVYNRLNVIPFAVNPPYRIVVEGNARGGVTAGFTFDFVFPAVVIGLETLYVQKGEKFIWSIKEDYTTLITGYSTFKLDYFEIPFLVKVPIIPEVRVYSGLSLAMRVRATEIVDLEAYVQLNDAGVKRYIHGSRKYDIGYLYKKDDYSFICGAQTKLKSFTAEIRYSHSLDTINTSWNPNETKNSSIIISGGFYF